MKLVLVLMIKNEEKILKRCLEAVQDIVDCFCITDTGSTDSSVEIANEFLKTHTGNVATDVWKNFGYNRTLSFSNAQTYVKTLNWNMAETYGLLLDGDMVFVPGTIKSQILTHPGYKIIQANSSLEFYNTRFIRMDIEAKCVGVTHEFWAVPSETLSKDICYINDIGDGGSKGDKFERDKRLLEQGLIDDPTNGRYMFYLAQTLKDSNHLKEAIAMYKKRIIIGGWQEEVWHSHYSIGQCYRRLENIPKYEYWMNRAFQFYPVRSEPILDLTRFFREKGQNYKAYHYYKLGVGIPYPKNNVLFIESFPYQGGFDYEASILDYYVHPKTGLDNSIDYMLKSSQFQQNVVSNLKFYVNPISSSIEKLVLPSPFGETFTPSAISIINYPFANVRYINYLSPKDGNYITRDGSPIQTKNAYVNLDTMSFINMINVIPKFDSHVNGFEDLRLYNYHGKLMFTATSFKEEIEGKISIVHGEYDINSKLYKNYCGIQSPINSVCEKNWVNVPGTDEFIYSWSPLRIGKIQENKFYFNKEIDTPPIFSLFRGSASPIEVNGRWIVLVHFVEYCQPRNYYHCFVELEKSSYTILKVSLPFVFEKLGIEFCISGRLVNESLEYYFSSWDCNPAKITIDIPSITWKVLNESTNNIVRVPSNVSCYWDGAYSRCHPKNHIETYLNESITKQSLNVSAIFSTSDGIVDKTEFNALQKDLGYELVVIKSDSDYELLVNSAKPNTAPIVTMLCSRNFYKPLLLLPLDDNTFKYGLATVLLNIKSPTWNDRKSIAFWRGGSSGFDTPKSIRMKVTKKLFGNPLTDVRITKWGNWENGKDIPDAHFGSRCPLDEYFKYKYIFIIDGNLIASNHQWVFGSGSVPIMITHPNNMYWFKKYLKPMENYVPIQYDLSDLEEKIQWLVDNKDEARKIAENALQFSKEVFSPEFQQKYIDDELKLLKLSLS